MTDSLYELHDHVKVSIPNYEGATHAQNEFHFSLVARESSAVLRLAPVHRGAVRSAIVRYLYALPFPVYDLTLR